MITELTKEQEAKIPEYIEKWVNKCSEPMNHKKAIKYTNKMYKVMGEDLPLIIFGDSPMNTVLLCALFFSMYKHDENNIVSQLYSKLRSQLESKLDSQLDSKLESQLYSKLRSKLNSKFRSKLRSQLDSKLESQLDSKLNSQLHSKLDSKLDSQLDSKLESQLESQLYSKLRSQLDSKLESQLYSKLRSKFRSKLNLQLHSKLHSQLKNINKHWYLGIYWLIWCGIYDYAKMIGVNFDNDIYELFINFNSEVNFIIPYKGICFISEKPNKINWLNGNLHKDGGLAVEYPDGYGMYCLNGVTVPEYLAMTPEGELDIEFFKKEKNADVKAEFIRKFGIERMESLGNKKDTWENYKTNEWWVKSEYELIDMSSIFESINYAPHLKMRNQTTGVFHLEAVSPECQTLEDAISFRWDGRDINNYITEVIK